jgi:hypothetical protein
MRNIALLTITLSITITAVARADPNGGYQSQQGTQLFGTLAPFDGMDIRFDSATLNGRPYSLSFRDGKLIHDSRDGKPFIDSSLKRGLIGVELLVRNYVLTIKGVNDHINIYNENHDIKEYDVVWEPLPKSPGGTNSKRLCPDDYRAVAVPGTWQNNLHKFQLQEDSSVFTFACANVVPDKNHCMQKACDGGVIAKCIDYGYPPWALHASSQLPNADTSARQLHNLCVVAMRADYAGNGWPNTLDGTLIRMFDATNLGEVECNWVGGSTICKLIHSPVYARTPETASSPSAPTRVAPAPPPPPQSTEQSHVASLSSTAGVSPAQIAAMQEIASTARRSSIRLPAGEVQGLVTEGIWTITPKGTAHALCLSKERWETIRPQSHPTPARYCDSFIFDNLNTYKPFLISYSAHIDRGLHRFRNGTNYITTTHVQLKQDGSLQPDPALCPNPSDCSRYRYENYEGTVLSPNLGVPHKGPICPPRGSSPVGLIAALAAQYQPHLLYSYLDRNQGRTVTTGCVTSGVAQDVPQGDSIFAEGEGYLFGALPPESRIQQSGSQVVDQELSMWPINGTYITAVRSPLGGTADPRLLGTLLGHPLFRPVNNPLLSDLFRRISLEYTKQILLISPNNRVPQIGPVFPDVQLGPVAPALPSNHVKPTNR